MLARSGFRSVNASQKDQNKDRGRIAKTAADSVDIVAAI